MCDCQGVSGLPICLNDKGLLTFVRPGLEVKPLTRTLDEMRAVLQDEAAAGPNIVYSMYRDVSLPQHREVIERLQIRYDLTVMQPGRIGKEYVKTMGHYHPLKEDSNVSYPEAYEVIHGQALFLLQRKNRVADKVEHFVAVKAEAGQKVVVSPNYGHVTVNLGTVPLVLGNWVERNFESNYQDVTGQQGFAYYVIEADDGKPLFVSNTRYKQGGVISTARRMAYPDFGLYEGIPMYGCIATQPERLEFLTNPQYYGYGFHKYFSTRSNIAWRPLDQ